MVLRPLSTKILHGGDHNLVDQSEDAESKNQATVVNSLETYCMGATVGGEEELLHFGVDIDPILMVPT